MPTLLFDGMLLFVLSLGLAVTLGLMNFINLAHRAFAMAGCYIRKVERMPAMGNQLFNVESDVIRTVKDPNKTK